MAKYELPYDAGTYPLHALPQETPEFLQFLTVDYGTDDSVPTRAQYAAWAGPARKGA